MTALMTVHAAAVCFSSKFFSTFSGCYRSDARFLSTGFDWTSGRPQATSSCGSGGPGELNDPVKLSAWNKRTSEEALEWSPDFDRLEGCSPSDARRCGEVNSIHVLQVRRRFSQRRRSKMLHELRCKALTYVNTL